MKKINFFAFLLANLVTAQTTFSLVKDINPGNSNSSPTNFAVLNNKLYFSAISPNIGNELWVTDGTESGTQLVEDYLQGSSSTAPSNTVAFNNKLYFSGAASVDGSTVYGALLSYSEENGIQLISSTVKNAAYFTNIEDQLYFKGTNSAVTPNTSRLYFLDDNIPAIADDNFNLNVVAWIGDDLLLNGQLATAEYPSRSQLFGYDNSAAYLIKEINPNNYSYPQNFFYSSSLKKTFFNANAGNGNEPWITDGTPEGTKIIKDINITTEVAGSGPANFAELNGKVYFSASDGVNGTELWVTDGTEGGTHVLKDIVAGSAGSYPEKLTVFNGKIYFLLTNTNNTRQLWETDGTEEGTQFLATLGMATNLVVYSQNLYLVGRLDNNDSIGLELYKINLSDETLGAQNIIKEASVSVYPNPVHGKVYVKGMDKGSYILYDMSGKAVISGKFVENNPVNVNVMPGVYQMKIISENGKSTSSNKIIVK